MTKLNIQHGDEVREMTEKEYAHYLIITDNSKEVAAADAQAAAKTSAQTKLAALGLTADEIAAL